MRPFLLAAGPAALAATTGGSADAHALLKDATPAAGSVLATAPAEVTIDFTEDVEPRFSRIVVQDSGGRDVQSGDARTNPGAPARLSVALRELTAGTYKVVWHATSVNTHKILGSYSFTVGK